jgi:hypothetical protein
VKKLGLIIAVLFLLTACSGSEVLNQKQEADASEQSESAKINVLTIPPWETFVKAGPGAENDLDLETLNGPQQVEPEIATTPKPQAPPLEQIAEVPEPEAVVPKPAPAPAPAKPGQTVIAAVAVPTVKGAPGEGNAELTTAMRNALKKAGWPVLEAPRKDALVVQGQVAIAPVQGDSQTVKIIWVVNSPDGKLLGDLKQDNAVPAGSLDQSWGENAGFAADAAAEGIFELIKKYR